MLNLNKSALLTMPVQVPGTEFIVATVQVPRTEFTVANSVIMSKLRVKTG